MLQYGWKRDVTEHIKCSNNAEVLKMNLTHN